MSTNRRMTDVSSAGRLRATDPGHGGPVRKRLSLVAICTGARGHLADVLSSGSADGLRDVFLACGAGGVVGGLLVLWLVRTAAPSDSVRRPCEDAAPEPAAR
jgi:hypothetical protein